ncbi:hypothetical protein [Cytobacillus pseudoceanisediminis]|uniref:hypothetical protein n=1 Tax=Cytobacillus pseudoceanisediminis TaxID=3051614 RepID=UPI003C2DBDFB
MIPKEACQFEYTNLSFNTRLKKCPQESKEHEYIIGIAPYQNGIMARNIYEDNSGSIPDAWICGENFNLLFEFKIRGKLDESQLAAHKRLIGKDGKIIRLTWENVIKALQQIVRNDANPLITYLIEQFIISAKLFKSKRNASGMPKQIISHINKSDELHFVITGSKESGQYQVDMKNGLEKTTLSSSLKGIQDARRFIADYVWSHELPIIFTGLDTVVNDYCVVPGRAEHKNQWNQWKLGGFLKIDKSR